ncbi:hypothetical protein LTR37_010790 [Vermiconidia calcicola]|uniref:Uncharacterized protein n=1 Tax=Vermiconidia calcicola TaxID=1690605 RepID=A0ACC3N3Y0_9PEZI|nr:hypothetical protein LTR37_010790 [Vermiconidia calcicola]
MGYQDRIHNTWMTGPRQYQEYHNYPSVQEHSILPRNNGGRGDRYIGAGSRAPQPGPRAHLQTAREGFSTERAPSPEEGETFQDRWHDYGFQLRPENAYQSGYEREYPNWQHSGSSWQDVYSTPQADQVFYEPVYRDSHMYAPFDDVTPSYRQYGYQPSQPWLTQQRRSGYDAPPPPAPARPLQPQKYNAKAPAFKPEQQQKSVYVADSNEGYRINKKSRYERTSCNPPRVPQSDGMLPPSPPNESGMRQYPNSSIIRAGIERTVNALPGKKTGSKPGVKPQSSSANQPPFDLPIRSSPGKLPHIQLLPRPKPTPHYMQQAMQDPQPRSHPRQLLVVVDLNGTLLFRKNRGSSFLARPKAKEFLRYILQNHKVMVWSSAQPENVRGMCDKLFTASQRDQLIAIWARDKLRLPPQALHQKVQVYKQLSWIWSDKSVRSTHPDTASVWSQVDTVLIDDSMEKAASEPYSIIQLEEFEGKAEQMEADVLGQVVSYLEMLRWEKDVSAYMQWMPFEFDPEMKVDWARFIGDTE